MKRTFLMTGLAVLTLAFFMTEGSDRNSRCGLC